MASIINLLFDSLFIKNNKPQKLSTCQSGDNNMEYEMIKKIRQNTTWIEADILGINLTPNRYNALAPAIVYVSNDVTIPFNSVTSQ